MAQFQPLPRPFYPLVCPVVGTRNSRALRRGRRLSRRSADRLRTGRAAVRRQDFGNDPTILAKATRTLEALSLKHRHCSIMQEGSNGPTFHFIGVTFHRSAPQTGDFLHGTVKSNARDPLAAIGLVDEKTGNPPIREGRKPFAIRTQVLDARKLVRRPELTPTDAGRAVKHEGSMGMTFLNSTFLLGSILLRTRCAFHAPRVKSHAPAATPYAVVSFDQPSELRPCGSIQKLHVKVGHHLPLLVRRMFNRFPISSSAQGRPYPCRAIITQFNISMRARGRGGRKPLDRQVLARR